MPSVTRKSRSNRAQRRESVQSELFRALDRLLGKGGSYTELSVESLVKEAGISRSTFYVYFEDKGDLLRALTDEVAAEITAAGRGWRQLPPGASKDEIRDALSQVFTAYRPHRAVLGAVVDTAAYDAAIQRRFGTLMSELIHELAAHIRSGQKSGNIRGGLDPDRTAAWLAWMAERGLNQLVAEANQEESDRLLAALADIVWNTLYESSG